MLINLSLSVHYTNLSPSENWVTSIQMLKISLFWSYWRWHSNFSRRWLKLPPSEMWHLVVWHKITNVSVGYTLPKMSTLKMEALHCSKTPINFYQTHILEEYTNIQHTSLEELQLLIYHCPRILQWQLFFQQEDVGWSSSAPPVQE